MKKLFVVILALTVFVGLFADKVQTPSFELSPTANITGATTQNRETWDILYSFNASAAAMPGVETDNVNIYTTTWNAGVFSRYEMDGTYLEDFTIAGATNIRDMAYDGTYFYGSPSSMSIYIMDLANETLIGTIPVTCAGLTGVRHIAYDPLLDGGNGGFWVGNWAELGAIAMDGSQIYANIAGIAESCYGSAYDEWTDGGPYLWLHFQIGSGCELHQFDIASQTLTGVMHDASEIPGFIAGSIAGGLATYITDDGIFAMLTNIQQDPNLIGVYELAVTADPAAPGAPTDVVLTPDAGGALEAVIDWVCPDLTVSGDPLTELDEMQVYRDGDLIYTDTSPTIGGVGTYTDVAIPSSGDYSYSVMGVNSAGDGLSVSVSSWIGEDVPAEVTDLVLESVGGNGYLTWVNPTTGLNGGAFNEPILGYHIERNDGTVFEITGEVVEWTDNSIPGPDYYYYTVTPYNAIGDGGIATSNTVLIGAGDEIFFDDFEAGLVNWNSIINSGAGEWIVYSQPYPNAYNMPPTSSGNVCSADADEAGSGTTTDCTIELVSPLNLSAYSTVNIQFDNDFNAIDADDYCYVDVTSDGGATWTNVLEFAGVDVTATHEIIDITAEAAGQADVNIRFHSVQPGWDWWWTIDNVGVYGTAGGDPGSIEGTITLDGGTGNVEDVEVTAGGNTVNPDTNGDYMITVYEGTYDVTATLAGYETAVAEDVVVTEGNATTGVDLTLTFIPTVLDPVQNLMVDEATGLLTWEAPGGGALVELVQHDGNPQNAYFQAYDNGYGVVYDVSGYSDVTIEMVDFRHSSWGITGTWDYSIHIVDWDTYTELEEVTGLVTTVNDDWELEVDLGSVSASGLVGIFMEPMGNSAVDAYPCMDSDNVGPDGMSYWGPLADYSGMALSDIGDFLMDLWIMGAATEGIVQAPKYQAKFGDGNARLESTVPDVDFFTLNQTSRDLTGYNVYLEDILQGNTSNLEYQLESLVNGVEYVAGVEAVYDEGNAEISEVTFTYTGPNEAGNVIIAATKLDNNYPNPFNPVTNIAYSIKETGNVSLEVYNLKGQL
ncbi:MAG: carboxypeptidase-like regulatory domain-containing protein, partial [Candidatus Cloacimonetes bacterium]|nr:carboxypeptidase-like regulatory domain-containing protein [Candidatus Cloacimonadota bacterium]